MSIFVVKSVSTMKTPGTTMSLEQTKYNITQNSGTHLSSCRLETSHRLEFKNLS